MKKSLFTLFALMLSMVANAQLVWDFSQISEADTIALQAATSDWSYTASNNRYQNLKDINGPLMAGNTELQLTKGLKLNGKAGKLRIDAHKRIQLAGKGVQLIIPSLKKGQQVTIRFASTGNTPCTLDSRSNMDHATGFDAADKNTVQTGVAIVTADGDVSFASTGGSLNIFSVEVSAADDNPDGEPTPVSDHSVAQSAAANQAVITLAGGDVKYYNTADVASIDIDEACKVTISTQALEQDVFNSVSNISFAKKQESAEPGEIVNGELNLTEAKGWLETLFVKWELLNGASNYNVYVKGGKYADWTKIDQQLVRNYGTYGRADAVGLIAATYSVKVVPVIGENEATDKASMATNIQVKSYRRDGYAHYNASEGIGAYNNDGSLKNGARVIYVTKDNAKTVALSMSAGKKAEERVGIQSIIQAYEKGTETTPLAVRIIGQLTKADMDELGSSAIGLQVKGKGQNMNLTIEGVGNDATLHGFGILVRACKYVELRNFAVMMHPEDGISFDTNNEHVWGHNLDIFYGQNKGGDKSKGDGSFDVKGTLYCTVSDNHFWDSGKCNLNSNGDEVDYVTYHHNWYDHSDSRHPRVRKSKHLHVFNNYFDGNAKYGVGSTTGSNIFVEKNNFRNCKYPMLISKQGSDISNGVGSSADTKGTFSSEDGGIIKAFDNLMTGQKSFEPWIAGDALYSKHFDAYLAQTRDEQVPAEVVALQGGATYNNFDTASDFYTYTPDAAADVPAVVTGAYGAGRCEHGDFQWTFDNATEDTNYDVILPLSNALKDYKSALVGYFGEEQGSVRSCGSGVNPDPVNPEDSVVTPMPEGVIFCSFDKNGVPSNSFFTVTGNGSNSKGTVTIEGQEFTTCLKMESATSVKFTLAKSMKMTLDFASTETASIKINGTKIVGSGNTYTETLEAGTYELTKDKSVNLFGIKLEPVE